MDHSPNFALYNEGDAYSTATKIMGRQSAGKAFIKGMARTWASGAIMGVGPSLADGQALARQLAASRHQGKVSWSSLPEVQTALAAGAVYYPSPSPKELAHLRNLSNPAGFSLMGVTFTLSSTSAMDQVAELILPPFRPWDALICISQCARTFVLNLHEEMKAWWTDQAGPLRFNTPQLPVILLGVDVPGFAPQPGAKAVARRALGLQANDVVFLFSGRLSFHAKANQAPMYQALEAAAQSRRIVCIEAGVFPNDGVRQGFLAAQKALAPSVRFIWADGQQDGPYRQAWQAADVFVSLADNIQETFGLTPVEAMAAGLPVIVSDWNGYKETVRDGVDGIRIPTVLPPEGAGADLAMRHALELDTYDFFIGRTSLATVVVPHALAEAIRRLADDANLRQTMGQAGLQRAREVFDWPIILRQYEQLADQLGELRKRAAPEPGRPRPGRADPFRRFAHFPTGTLGGEWRIAARPEASARLKVLLSLSMASYAFDRQLLPHEVVTAILSMAERHEGQTVNEVLSAAGHATPVGVRALMWLWKFDLLAIRPTT